MTPAHTTRRPGARPDKHDFDTLTGNTWSVHGGNYADQPTGAIRTPIVMANSYRLPEDPSTIDDPDFRGLVYTREHGANQRGLEEKLARLDHGGRPPCSGPAWRPCTSATPDCPAMTSTASRSPSCPAGSEGSCRSPPAGRTRAGSGSSTTCA